MTAVLSSDLARWQKQLEQRWAAPLRQARDRRVHSQVMADFLQQVETDLRLGLKPQEAAAIACSAGCGTCCQVHVAVLEPEALHIAAYLRQTRSATELAELRRRMNRLCIAIEGLDEEERAACGCHCVFLDSEGHCTIYPVRPLLCRAVTSTCPRSCRDALRLSALGEQVPVLMNLFQKELMESAFRGLAHLWQQQGGDGRSFELTAAVRRALYAA